MGIYHRLESPTQTAKDAEQQEVSNEIWGRAPRTGLEPAVQAYVGPLREGARGVEFRTTVSPDRGCAPGEARWRGPRDGVRVVGEFAILSVEVTKNTQTEPNG